MLRQTVIRGGEVKSIMGFRIEIEITPDPTHLCYFVLLPPEEDGGVLDEGAEHEQYAGQHPRLDGRQS